jgi:hypothetical protein
MTRAATLLVVAAMAVAAVVVLLSRSPRDGGEPAMEAPLSDPSASGEPTMETSPPDPSALTVFFSGEESGYLEPCGCDDTIIGGFPRRFSVMESTSREGGATMALENGDLNEDLGEQQKLKYRYQMQTLQAIGCHALNIGEKDLALGVDHLREMQALAAFPFLTTNILQAPDTPLFEPVAYVPLRVGAADRQAIVLGVLADSLLPYAEQQGLLVRPAREAVDEALMGLTADLRILLFHGDRDEASAIFGDHKELDLIIAGHRRPKSEEIRRPGAPPIFVTGEKGKELCRVRVTFDDEGARIGTFDPVTLTNRIPDSPFIVPILRQYYDEVAQLDLIDKLAIEYPPGGQQYVGSRACRGGCHEHDAAHKIWKESKHSKAIQTLADKGRDKDPECVVCHAVGLGFESGFSDVNATPDLAGVGCESCHGVGSGHAENPEKGFGHARGEKSCLPCHDPEHSPKFDFQEYWAKIEH